MIVRLHRDCEKDYRKLRTAEQKRFRDRIARFAKDPSDPILHHHPLRGAYEGYWSINVGGDLRAIYRPIADDMIYFVAIGTHHELYSQ